MKAEEFWDESEMEEGIFTKKQVLLFAEAYAKQENDALQKQVEDTQASFDEGAILIAKAVVNEPKLYKQIAELEGKAKMLDVIAKTGFTSRQVAAVEESNKH